MRLHSRTDKRSGNVLVLCAVSMVAVLGMCSLALDIGYMVQTKHEFQAYVDGLCLKGGAVLASVRTNPDNPYESIEHVRNAIFDYARTYPVHGEYLTTRQIRIEVGRAEADEKGYYHFVGSSGYSPDQFNAVKVQVNSSPIDTILGGALGQYNFTIEASASVMILPYDLSFSVDSSRSMLDDSRIGIRQLGILDSRGVEPNLYDIWISMPSGPGDPGYTPYREGPCFGDFMRQRGYGFAGSDPTEHLNALYNAAMDPGLLRIVPGDNTPELEQMIRDQGYNEREVQEILSANEGGANGTEYPRTAYYTNAEMPAGTHHGWYYTATIALGLSWWNSGLDEPDAKWKTMGPGGTEYPVPGVGAQASGELHIFGPVKAYEDTFQDILPLVPYPYGSPTNNRNSWFNYLKYVSNPNIYPEHNLRCRFGIKTFMDFLLWERNANAATPELANTPVQPLQAVKNAAQILADQLVIRDNQDRVALETFSYNSHHEVSMVDLQNLQLVLDRLRALQPGHYSTSTNIQATIRESMYTLLDRPMYDGSPVSSNRQKYMVILTDGLTNMYLDTDPSGNIISVKDENSAEACPTARAHALSEARLAAEYHIRIDTITMGSATSPTGDHLAQAAWALMEEIAEIGGGNHYHVEGSPEEIEELLQDVFDDISGSGVAALIE